MMKVLQYAVLTYQADAIQVEIRAAVTKQQQVYKFDCKPLRECDRVADDPKCRSILSVQREHPLYIPGSGSGRKDWCRVCGFDMTEFVHKYGQRYPGIFQGTFIDDNACTHPVCKHCVDLQKSAERVNNPKDMMFMTSMTDSCARGDADPEHLESIRTMKQVFGESFPGEDVKEHFLIPKIGDSAKDYVYTLQALADRGGCNVLWMQDHQWSSAFEDKKVQRLLSTFLRIGIIKRIVAITCSSKFKMESQVSSDPFEYTTKGDENFDLARTESRPKVFLFDSGSSSIRTTRERGLHFRNDDGPATDPFGNFIFFLNGARILSTSLGASILNIVLKEYVG